MKTKYAVTLGLVALLVMILGSAQAATQIRANIPFQFVVEGKTLPAGEYDLVRNDNDQSIQVIAVKKGPSADALVVTKISGAIHTTPQDTHIIFDKVGDTYYLSELWIPDFDGYLLRATKEKHTHRSINVPS
jgi:hypothetical protein